MLVNIYMYVCMNVEILVENNLPTLLACDLELFSDYSSGKMSKVVDVPPVCMYVCMYVWVDVADSTAHSVWLQAKSAYDKMTEDNQVKMLLHAIKKGECIFQ